MASDEGYQWRELCEDFRAILESDDNYDVIIRSGQDSTAEDLQAHSVVLRARCPFFKSALTNKWKEKTEDGKCIIMKPNISPDVFRVILRYLYTGFTDYKQLNAEMIANTLLAADELGMDKLIEHLQNYITNPETPLEDPLTALEIIYNVTSLEGLKDWCLRKISENPSLLFSSEKFPLVEKPILEMILDRDDLEMKEVDVWDSVLRWHLARYLKKGEKIDVLSQSDSCSMEQSIKEFIPLIRIHDISKEDFYLKVYPFRDMLPKDLLDDVLRYHLLPNAVPKLSSRRPRNKCDSILIKRPVFRLFQKWICKNDAAQDTHSFKLLFRGTRDGFTANAFHQKCDDKGATLTVAKLKDSQKIVGGYNPLSWSCSGQYSATYDSFLFQLDPNDLVSPQLGRVNSNNYTNAVYNNSGNGPTFGGGHDLIVQHGTTWTYKCHSYPNISLQNSFIIQDYEVFQVEKIK